MSEFNIDISKSSKYDPVLVIQSAFKTYNNFIQAQEMNSPKLAKHSRNVSKSIKQSGKKLVHTKDKISPIDLINLLFVLDYYLHFLHVLANNKHQSKQKQDLTSYAQRNAVATMFSACAFIHKSNAKRLIDYSASIIREGFQPKDLQKKLIAELHGKRVLRKDK